MSFSQGFSWVFGVGLCCAGCVGPSVPQSCAPEDVQGTTLSIHDSHEFGKNYDVFELLVKVDDCILFHSDDTQLLSHAQIDIPARPAPAGRHKIEVDSKYRSGFSADMHDYEWYVRGVFDVEITADVENTLLIRRTEIMNKDPRARVQTQISVHPK